MRFFLTLLCMVVFGMAAVVLVVVDLVLRWLPVLAVAAAVIVAVRISRRRRHPHPRVATAPPAAVNVPDATAFAAIASAEAHVTRVYEPSPTFARISTKVGQEDHAAPWRGVADGTVIGADGHHG